MRINNKRFYTTENALVSEDLRSILYIVQF